MAAENEESNEVLDARWHALIDAATGRLDDAARAELYAHLAGADEDLRAAARYALGVQVAQGAATGPALGGPALIEDLSSALAAGAAASDVLAVVAAAGLGPEVLLGHCAPREALRLLEALGACPAGAEHVLDVLLRDGGVEGARVFARLGPVDARGDSGLLEHPDLETRIQAAARLDSPRAGALLQAALEAGGRLERVAALEAITRAAVAAGSDPERTFWAVFHRLEDPEVEVRAAAAQALGALARHRAEGRAEAVARLVERLQDPAYAVRASASEALGGLGAAAEPAIEPLIDALVEPRPDGDFFMSIWAIVALARLVPASLPRLMEVVERHPDPRRRAAAATALGEAGPRAHAARPALLRAHAEGPEIVTLRAAAALAATGHPEDGMPTLLGALRRAPSPVRMQVAFILGRLPETNAAVITALAAALDDPAPRVRAQALESLARSGEAAEAARPRIERCLRDPDRLVRAQALGALAALSESGRRRLAVTVGLHKALPGVVATGDGHATTGSKPMAPSRGR